MGDRVAVMKGGILQQVDTPLALYDSPANLFVAGFIGSPAMNLLEGTLSDTGAIINGHAFPVPVTAEDRAANTGSVTVGVRPEALRVAEDGKEGIPVKVTLVEELGADAYLYGITDDAEGASEVDAGTNVIVRVEARRHFDKGQTVYVTSDPKNVHVFNTESGERVGKHAPSLPELSCNLSSVGRRRTRNGTAPVVVCISGARLGVLVHNQTVTTWGDLRCAD